MLRLIGKKVIVIHDDTCRKNNPELLPLITLLRSFNFYKYQMEMLLISVTKINNLKVFPYHVILELSSTFSTEKKE